MTSYLTLLLYGSWLTCVVCDLDAPETDNDNTPDLSHDLSLQSILIRDNSCSSVTLFELHIVLQVSMTQIQANGSGVCFHHLYRTMKHQWSETSSRNTFVSSMWLKRGGQEGTLSRPQLTDFIYLLNDNHRLTKYRISSKLLGYVWHVIQLGLRLCNVFQALCLLENVEHLKINLKSYAKQNEYSSFWLSPHCNP